jgi:uncharacterized protein
MRLNLILLFFLLCIGCSKIYERGLVHHKNLKEHYKTLNNSDNSIFSHVTLKGQKFTGNSIDTFENGNLQFIREYLNGIPTGSYTSYFKNGIVELEIKTTPYPEFILYDSTGTKIIHRMENQSGSYEETIFYENGNTKERFIDKTDGFYSQYYKWDYNGNLLELYIADSIYYLSDALTGQLLEKGEKDDFRNKQGLYTYFYSNGQPKIICNYIHDLLNGLYQSFHQNGRTETTGYYKTGNRENSWIIYDESGLLRQEFSYKNGNLDGKFSEYWENGNLKTIGLYEIGMKRGQWKFYTISGKLLEELEFN